MTCKSSSVLLTVRLRSVLDDLFATVAGMKSKSCLLGHYPTNRGQSQRMNYFAMTKNRSLFRKRMSLKMIMATVKNVMILTLLQKSRFSSQKHLLRQSIGMSASRVAKFFLNKMSKTLLNGLNTTVELWEVLQ